MKKRWWFFLLAGVVVVGAVTINREPTPETVTTAVLTAGRVEQTISCTGMVESGKTTKISLPITCVIRSIGVKEGDRVEQGDVLATIDKEATLAILEEGSHRAVLAAMDEKITAPSSGVVVAVSAVEGVPLEQGIPCLVLSLEQDLQVRICLREKDLKVIQPGMVVRLTGDGFARSVYSGVLTEISAAARTDTASGTIVEGVVKFDEGESDTSLRLGLTARATVVTSVTEAGLLVPHEALLNDGDGYYVYLLRDGCAYRQNIQVAGRVAAGILLADRSLEGQTVICHPSKTLRDGMAVEESR